MSHYDVLIDAINANGNEEMTIGQARELASYYHNGQASIGYAFASSGSLPTDTESPASDVWRDLFSDVYSLGMSRREQEAADRMGTFLLQLTSA